MNAPRLEVDLDKIHHNAKILVSRLAACGISVTAVMKSSLGSPEIARAVMRAGVSMIGDSRMENIEAMSRAGINAPMMLIRSPMISDAHRVVRYADLSLNSELDVIRQLSYAAKAAGKRHGVVLMVELGDLREGIMPADLEQSIASVLDMPSIELKGIGANLACHCGVSPDSRNMDQLSALTRSMETTFGISLEIVSGGNSANLNWGFSGADTGRINNLRLGESILLGCEPLHRQPIEGLYTDAITLVAEVIESKVKPSQPWGEIGQNAFGEKVPMVDRGNIAQAILAIGRQDVDPDGLESHLGIDIIGASSDHLIMDCGDHFLPVGAEVRFQLNYSAMVRAMTSPFVTKVLRAS
ncbi:alanine/ornithine racemase family PLP-dependent enzyme [Motiliproteus sp. MSK22-1]|uniref:alanine/ornithine racemase family PLP-dependent enzyme n=1 Tax=Motiliproteus sp. MSK22-1 TaxID=1897630 RepID=UPI000977E9A8|nr:alanine/ornithine racemase family PLP-dependent enzyme [Motiliproteus sp. MSK22-1]OMH39290.1 alanine racemase [Motiliproteus sp. MSK22-1]